MPMMHANRIVQITVVTASIIESIFFKTFTSAPSLSVEIGNNGSSFRKPLLKGLKHFVVSKEGNPCISRSANTANATESAGALGIPLHGPIALPDVVDPSAMALLTEQITAQLTPPIAGWLARIAAYLLTFFAAYLILRFALRIVDLVMKLPLLREANTLLGGICGVLLGAGYAWITAQALSLVLGILVTNGTLPSEVMGGVVFGWMTNLIA